MTALSPGASPPPVVIATRTSGRQALLKQGDHLTGVGMALLTQFGEHQIALKRDLECPARGFDQTHLRVWPDRTNLGRQTGSSWFVVSDDAILNGNNHDPKLTVACSFRRPGTTFAHRTHEPNIHRA